MRQTAAAIDIGTSKVVCMIAEKGVYDGFNLLGISVNEYAGYDRSGWLEPRELKYTISSVLREAEKQAGRRLRRVHVGVPGDFTEVILKKASLSFGKARRMMWSCFSSAGRIFPQCAIILWRIAAPFIFW